MTLQLSAGAQTPGDIPAVHSRGSRRGAILFCSVLAVSALVGGLFGPTWTASAANADQAADATRTFTSVLATVEANYADPVDADKVIYDGAIPGMLHSLDPHSNFFDPQEYALFRENQEGKYYGVGMIVEPRQNQTMVLAPFDGSPAAKAGIRPGDIILSVDGKDCAGLTTTQVADLLKGAKGTSVHIMIEREGWVEPIPMTVTRDEIPRPGVEFSEMVRPGIGYVHVTTFNETTDSDLADALKQLDYSKLDGLIIDLRENGGGLLNQAVGMADMFLDQNQLVVSHHGRSSPERRYYAVRGNRGIDVPLVFVVNRDSASASEIVSGAIQDHDRGLIVGETTFGKGLVQTQFQLSEDTALLLTTARYYTPSGRLIQRDYRNVTLWDYHNNPQKPKSPELKYTDSGRPVYGGDGITPDVAAPAAKPTEFETMLLARSVFFPTDQGVGDFVRYYLGTKPTITQDFTTDDSVIAQLQKFLDQQHIQYTQADIQQNLPWLKWETKREVFTTMFGLDAGYKVELENDPQLDKAIESLPQAKALYANVRKIVAQRQTAGATQQ
ncbi:MAG TPA: S41 family peptidase [Candidatus Aquilonibacter sp.]|nr:S41 family peptidase [Candidatus Aquilonibacter sp.]